MLCLFNNQQAVKIKLTVEQQSTLPQWREDETNMGELIGHIKIRGMLHFVIQVYFIILALSGVACIFDDNRRQEAVEGFFNNVAISSALILVPLATYLLLRLNRLSIYQRCIGRRTPFGTKLIPDKEVAGVSLKRFRETVNGVDTGTVHKLFVQSKAGKRIHFYDHLSNDETVLIDYVHRISRPIASGWMNEFSNPNPIEWNGKLRLHPSGLEVVKLTGNKNHDYKDLYIKLRANKLRIRNRDTHKVIKTISMDEWNFWPLLLILETLIEASKRRE